MKDMLNQPGNTSVARTSNLQFNLRENKEPLRLLSESDWAFWKSNGYVVIKDAVPEKNIDELVDLIWEFQEMNPDDRSTWYNNPANEMQMKELVGSGMVEMYNHQLQWNNRMHPKIYNAFVDIWGTEKLWVTIDRANLNLPNKPGHEYKGFVHWDIDTSRDPLPVNTQGVLALNDQTNENMGGFQCIPELYRQFSEWVKTQPADRNPHQPDITGFEIEKVKLEKGDFLIWDSMLAHGIRPNYSDTPRLAQYISMTPAQEHNEELRQWRIQSWRDRIAPEGYPFPGDPRKWEQIKYKRAELTELGKKLLGLKDW